MKIHELKASPKRARKRVGRGISSGWGKTSGRGTKGQKSRSGGNIKPGFEGGQTKLVRRLPKARGFNAKNPKIYQIINTSDLSKIKSAKIDINTLIKTGLVKEESIPVKLLGNGRVTKKFNISVNKASRSAIDKIKSKGGRINIVDFSFKKPAKVNKSEDKIIKAKEE